MRYNKILRQIAESENVSVEEVEREMKIAIAAAGLDCSVEEFIEKAASLAKIRLYIV
ncbi:MAG: hypothetical protein IKU25_07670 [Clostridia bacterium]|nr:hypothetical protein [Clostridia bacterium]